MDTREDHLGGLPALLALLGTSPTGDEVAAHLVDGPGRHFDAAVCSIALLGSDGVRIIGRHGYTPQDPNARYPLSLDVPVIHSIREGAVIVRETRQAEEEYEDLVLTWRHAPPVAGQSAIVCAPITTRGLTVGGYFLACESPPMWETLGYALLEGVGRSLALWIDKLAGPGLSADSPAAAELTPRQVAIVRMLTADRTTAAIAASLGCSASTVKTEVQRIGRALGASRRSEIVDRAGSLGLLDGDVRGARR